MAREKITAVILSQQFSGTRVIPQLLFAQARDAPRESVSETNSGTIGCVSRFILHICSHFCWYTAMIHAAQAIFCIAQMGFLPFAKRIC